MAENTEEKIQFHYLVTNFYFPNRRKLKSFISSLMRREGQKLGRISYIFCSDHYLLEINKHYLKHDTYTDIITFGLSPKGEPITAEVYISIERVRENAGLFNASFINELHRVIFHGALHLCGYTDKTKAARQTMRERESFYLNKYLVSRATGLKGH
jgi:probable rRNA maturation factor